MPKVFKAIALMLSSFMCCVSVAAADGLALDLRMTQGERSKDSHSTTWHITIQNGQLRYRQERLGFLDYPEKRKDKTFRLDAAATEAIRALIVQYRLNQTLTEKIPVDLGTYDEIQLELTDNGQRSTLMLSGPHDSAMTERLPYQGVRALKDEICSRYDIAQF